MKNPTILITGACGQLGSSMRKLASTMPYKFVFTDIVAQPNADIFALDITKADEVVKIVREEGINVIINCAAYTNVDAAEDNVQLARQLNAEAPAVLARAMEQVDGLLIHISTDYVFGGTAYNVPCQEEQKGNPTGVYGLTKWEGEQAIQQTGCAHIILRTAWLYSEYGHNFVKTMMRLTAEKPQLKVVFDQVGTPTYALDLAQAICTILKKVFAEPNRDFTGIYHFSNEGVCSWYDFAMLIGRLCQHNQCQIQPCHSSEFPSKVIRPPFSVLDKTKIKQTFDLTIPYWTDSLQTCVKNLCNE